VSLSVLSIVSLPQNVETTN